MYYRNRGVRLGRIFIIAIVFFLVGQAVKWYHYNVEFTFSAPFLIMICNLGAMIIIGYGIAIKLREWVGLNTWYH